MKFERSGKEFPLTHKGLKITDDMPIVTNQEIMNEMQMFCVFDGVPDGILENVSISVEDMDGNINESITESEFLDANASDAPWSHYYCVASFAVPQYDYDELEERITGYIGADEYYVTERVFLSWDEFQLVRQAESLCYLTGCITRIIANSFYNDTNRN